MIELRLPDSDDSPAIPVLVAFSIGIAADRWCELPWQIALTASVFGLLSWLIVQLFSVKRESLSAAMLLVAIAGAAGFWHHGQWNWYSPHEVATWCQSGPTNVCLRARVVGEARFIAGVEDHLFNAIPPSERTGLLLDVVKVRDGQDWRPASGRVNLTIHERTAHVGFGDVVSVVGRLVPITPPTAPGKFDFQGWYRSARQLASLHALHAESVTVEQQAGSGTQAAVLSWFRSRLDALLWKYFQTEQASLASAVLLGNREQLSAEQRDSFMQVGTAHLLAISGLHVGILAGLFLLLHQFGLIGRRTALASTIAFVLAYCWLVEFRPPVTRAAILISLYCIGRLVGRQGWEFNLLAVAGLIVLVLNPSDLFSLGPQLSFLAVATLITFKHLIFPGPPTDPLQRLIRNTRSAPARILRSVVTRCRQAVMISGLIWIVGLPLVAANFHLVTPVALAINPVLLLPFSFALYAGLAVWMFGFWAPSVAAAFGWAGSGLLGIVASLISTAESISFGHWWTAGPSTVAVAIFYVAMLSIALQPKAKRARMLLWVWPLWLAVGWLGPYHASKIAERNRSEQQLQVSFIDVGHGAAVLIELPGGRKFLYDSGSLASSRFAAETAASVLWHNNIEHLDAIIISHADIDHFNAVPGLAKKFSVGQVYFSQPMIEKRKGSESVAALIDLVEAQGIGISELNRGGQSVLDEQTMLEVISPPDFGTGDSDNSDSIVLLLRYADWTVLLPGDIEGRGLRMLRAEPDVDVDVTMLPHHGSINSEPENFVRWCRPEFAVISASRNRIDQQVIDIVSRNGCKVLPTSSLATIRLTFDRSRLQVEHWRKHAWRKIVNNPKTDD